MEFQRIEVCTRILTTSSLNNRKTDYARSSGRRRIGGVAGDVNSRLTTLAHPLRQLPFAPERKTPHRDND